MYYSRYGYTPVSHFGIYAPFTVPNEAFMVCELVRDALFDVKGMVEYPEEYHILQNNIARFIFETLYNSISFGGIN